MKKKWLFLSVLCWSVLCWFVISFPLWAEEELMTKLFFDNWLQKTTQPLEQSITQLQAQYAGLTKEIAQLRDALTTEIKVVIGQKTAYLDGRTVSLDVAPLITNDRTMVPVRFIGEAFGASFAWDEATRKVTYLSEEGKIELYIGQKAAYINGKKITLDTAPLIVSGRTMVPLRFISEQLHALVEWDGQTRTVMIHG